jgi:hypothetical protein
LNFHPPMRDDNKLEMHCPQWMKRLRGQQPRREMSPQRRGLRCVSI